MSREIRSPGLYLQAWDALQVLKGQLYKYLPTPKYLMGTQAPSQLLCSVMRKPLSLPKPLSVPPWKPLPECYTLQTQLLPSHIPGQNGERSC